MDEEKIVIAFLDVGDEPRFFKDEIEVFDVLSV